MKSCMGATSCCRDSSLQAGLLMCQLLMASSLGLTMLLLLICSLQQPTLQSDKSTWALANLLDSNLMHVRAMGLQECLVPFSIDL
jgi:hypothetical protein